MHALRERSGRVFCRTVQFADHDRLRGGKAARSLKNPPKMPHGTAGPLSCSTNDRPFPLSNRPSKSTLSAHRKAAEKFQKILTAVSPSKVRLCGHSVSGPDAGHLQARP